MLSKRFISQNRDYKHLLIDYTTSYCIIFLLLLGSLYFVSKETKLPCACVLSPCRHGRPATVLPTAAPCPVQARAHPCCAICRARPCALAEAAAAPTTTLGEIALGEVVLGDVMLDRAPRLHHSPWTHRPWKSCIVVLVFHEHYVSNKSCLHPTSCKY